MPPGPAELWRLQPDQGRSQAGRKGTNRSMTIIPDHDAPDADAGPRLSVTQVAARFHVTPRTITRWANLGILPCTRTVGGLSGRGHRRFREDDVHALLSTVEAQPGRGALTPRPGLGTLLVSGDRNHVHEA
jgi:excisionase family DNA binding protein